METPEVCKTEFLSNYGIHTPFHPLFIGECTTGDVRLLDDDGAPASSNAGNVFICVDNYWTNLYDDTWSNNDALVVCKMLNFQS